jgi:hypothetical protein
MLHVASCSRPFRNVIILYINRSHNVGGGGGRVTTVRFAVHRVGQGGAFTLNNK